MSTAPIVSPRAPRASVGARILLTIIGLTLAAAGIAFTWFLWHAYQRALETDGWTATPCVIRNAHVEETRENLSSPIQYAPSVLYNYTVESENRESSRIRRVPGQTFKERAEADAIIAKYPANQGAICYVNPDNPNEAILQRETHASVYSIWFPLLFFVGGMGMVIHIWWPQPKDAPNAA